MKDYWRIKNGYTNYDERISFNIAVVVCNNDTDSNCATKDDIDFLLDKLYFTFYVVEDNVSFSEVGQKPFYTVDKFHSQFVLSRTTYRDNNNFINVNKASSSDARYSITSDSNDYFFLNTELGPAWTSSSWVKPENTTDDKGVTWSTQADEIIFGAYFFLAEVRGVHTLSRYNTFSFLS